MPSGAAGKPCGVFTVATKLPDELRPALDRLCAERGVTRSGLLRLLVEEAADPGTTKVMPPRGIPARLRDPSIILRTAKRIPYKED